MIRPFALAAVCLTAIAAAADVPAEVRHAAQVAQADRRGIVGFEIVWDTDAHGGPFHQTYHYRNAYIFDGERFVGARAIEKVDNGRVAGPADLAGETRKIAENERSKAPGFADPFDDRHFPEYRFSRQPCDASCLEGDTTVAFTGLLADVNHGDGRLLIDRDGHVRRMVYVPKVMPSFGRVKARDAVITIERGPVLPGYWATLKSTATYSGRYGFITGSATQTARFDHYRRYHSVDAALSALNSGQI